MTRRRKKLLAAVVLALGLGVGTFAWYWHNMAVDRQVRALLYEVRQHDGMYEIGEPPTWFQRWLVNLGLIEDRWAGREYGSVIYDLSEIGRPAVPGIILGLQDSDPLVRSVAAAALGEIGDDRALEPLIEVLQDRDGSVRSWAAMALGDLGDARAVEPLSAALKDQESYVRRKAVSALGELGGAQAIEALAAVLNDDDEDEEVRQAAQDAIEQIRQRTATQPAAETQPHGE